MLVNMRHKGGILTDELAADALLRCYDIEDENAATADAIVSFIAARGE